MQKGWYILRIKMLVIIALFLAGCGPVRAGVKPASPTRTASLEALFTRPVPASSLPMMTPGNGGRYQITFYNRYAWELHLFMDGALLLSIPAGRGGTHSGILSGEHRFRFCHDRQGAVCLAEIPAIIDADMVWTVGDHAGALSTPSRSGSPTATPALPSLQGTAFSGIGPTPTLYRSTVDVVSYPVSVTPTAGPPRVGPPSAPTLTALAPTLAALAPTQTALALTPIPPTPTSLPPELDGFRVTVHNRYPSPLRVYVDDRYLMTVPSMKYLWFSDIPGGLRVFKLCPGDNWCLMREVYLAEDYVMYASP